jgi:hypothetical protein
MILRDLSLTKRAIPLVLGAEPKSFLPGRKSNEARWEFDCGGDCYCRRVDPLLCDGDGHSGAVVIPKAVLPKFPLPEKALNIR